MPKFGGRLESTIALRYLFAKKSHNAINIISMISVIGITVASMAMVVVLSVFNGFSELIEGLYSEFDPVVKVVPVSGKYFTAEQTDSVAQAVARQAGVEASCRVIEDQALILFRGHPQVVTVKGVDDNFPRVSRIKDICEGDGHYQLHRAEVEYAIPGIGLGMMMGGPNFSTFQLCAPRGGERINLMDPLESLSVVEVNSTGLVFNMSQRKYDEQYVLTSYGLAEQLFEKEGRCSAFELALKPDASVASVKQGLAAALTPRGGTQPIASAKDRMEQQEQTFNVMQIEKLLAYVFLTFILIVACFNVISSMSMLILEKERDAATLSCLGLPLHRLRRIFMWEGQFITLVGTLLGTILGVVMCLVQQFYGIIRLGTGDNFIVEAYPVSVHLADVGLIIITGLIVGYLATWYPVRYFTRHG